MLINEFPDVVAFTESWLDQSTPDSLLVDNNAYSVFRKDRFNEPYGGVCLLLKNATIKAVRVDVADNFNDIDVLCVDILDMFIPMRIIVGYRSPSSDTAEDAIRNTKHFIDCLSCLCDVDASVVIIGDFNFPSID